LQVCKLYPGIDLSTNTKGKNILTTCPICGHHDCFRITPETNQWNCFSAQHTGKKGSDVIHLVQELDHVNFATALHTLTERFRPDLLPSLDNGNGKRQPTCSPAVYQKIQQYWQDRHIRRLPESVHIKNKSTEYLTYVHPEKALNGKETALYQL
jgi:hypothetical protein